MKHEMITGEQVGLDLIQSLKEYKAGKTRVVYSPATDAREKLGMTQSEFAALMGVSMRTLQGWEQGIKKPVGAARSLIAIAAARPDVVRKVLAA